MDVNFFNKTLPENNYIQNIDYDKDNQLWTIDLDFKNITDITLNNNSKDIELLYKENENIIDQTRNHFEKHRALSDLIREVEENKELNDEDNDDYIEFL